MGLGLLIVGLAARRGPPPALRLVVACVGMTAVFTSPWLAHIDRSWLGAFPTIDKEGSLLFYAGGVHRRSLAAPLAADPAVQLIGVHLGHLWLVQAADGLLSPVGAFGAWSLLSPALNWAAMAGLLRETGRRWLTALAFAAPFGLGLHTFRDLDQTTIEKAQLWWIPLFGLALIRAARGAGPLWLPAAVAGAAAWCNLYMGAVIAGAALFGALPAAGALWRAGAAAPLRRGAVALGLCALPAALLVGWQAAVMRGAPPLASPERFIWERAALDSWSPLSWNRVPTWRAVEPLTLLAGLAAAARPHPARAPALLAALGLLGLAFGPALVLGDAAPPPTLRNPVYHLFLELVPGAWRLAKPEVFFQGVWVILLMGGAAWAEDRLPTRRARGIALGAVLLSLAILGRSAPEWPGLSAPLDTALDPGWAERAFGGG